MLLLGAVCAFLSNGKDRPAVQGLVAGVVGGARAAGTAALVLSPSSPGLSGHAGGTVDRGREERRKGAGSGPGPLQHTTGSCCPVIYGRRLSQISVRRDDALQAPPQARLQSPSCASSRCQTPIPYFGGGLDTAGLSQHFQSGGVAVG